MITLKPSSFTVDALGSEQHFIVYGNRYSIRQKSKNILLAYFAPGIAVLVLFFILTLLLSKYLSYAKALNAAVCLLIYIALVRSISKQRIAIIIDHWQGLCVNKQYYMPEQIRGLIISRQKTLFDKEGSSHIAVVLPTGEERLSPYIEKGVAKELLTALQTSLNQVSIHARRGKTPMP